MRDVLDGMRDFTDAACTGSQTNAMDILGIGRTTKVQRPTARIIPFPLRPRTGRKT